MSTARYQLLNQLRRRGPEGVPTREADGEQVKRLRQEGYAIQAVRDPDGPGGERRHRYVLRAEPEQRWAA